MHSEHCAKPQSRQDRHPQMQRHGLSLELDHGGECRYVPGCLYGCFDREVGVLAEHGRHNQERQDLFQQQRPGVKNGLCALLLGHSLRSSLQPVVQGRLVLTSGPTAIQLLRSPPTRPQTNSRAAPEKPGVGDGGAPSPSTAFRAASARCSKLPVDRAVMRANAAT